MKAESKIRFLFQHMVIYLVVGTLTILAVFSAALVLLNKEYHSNLAASSRQSLMMMDNAMSVLFAQMDSFTCQLSAENRYRMYDLDRQITTTMDLRRTLQNELAGRSHFTDIYYYTPGNPIVCGASSTYSLQSFALEMGLDSSDEFQKLYTNLDHSEVHLLTGENGEIQDAFFFYRLNRNLFTSDSLVCFRISDEKLRNLLPTTNAWACGLLLQTDRQNVLISSQSAYAQMMHSAIEQIDGQGGLHEVTLDGTRYFVDLYSNTDDSRIYISLQMENSALGRLTSIRWQLAAGTFLLLCVEMAAILWLSWRHLGSLHDLHRYLQTHFPQVASSNAHQLQHVQMLVEKMNENRLELMAELEVNNAALQEALLYHLLTGHTASQQHMQEINALARTLFTHHCFCAAVASINGEASESDLSLLRNCTQHHITGVEMVCGVLDGQLTLILSAEKESELLRDSMYLHAAQAFQQASGRSVHFAVGIPQEDISGILYSYLWALSVLRCNSEGKTVLIQEFASEIFQMASAEFASLLPMVRNQQPDGFTAGVSRMAEKLHSLSLGCEEIKLICYKCIHMLSCTLLETGRQQQAMELNYVLETRLQLENSAEGCLSLLLQSAERTAASLQPLSTEQNGSMSAVRRLLDHNVENPDFSIDQLCEELGLSRTLLRTQFQKEYGLTPRAYLDRLRMERVCWLLRETNHSLRVIAQRMGYADESSLSRKFKATMNRTPGAYRRMYQGDFTQKEK